MVQLQKTYGGDESVAVALDELSNFAIATAQTHVKDTKVLVLESLLLEAVTQVEANGDSKKSRSAIGMQKSFILSNVMGITEDDILPQIMEKANAVSG